MHIILVVMYRTSFPDISCSMEDDMPLWFSTEALKSNIEVTTKNSKE